MAVLSPLWVVLALSVPLPFGRPLRPFCAPVDVTRTYGSNNYVDEARQQNGPGTQIREPYMRVNIDKAADERVIRDTCISARDRGHR